MRCQGMLVRARHSAIYCDYVCSAAEENMMLTFQIELLTGIKNELLCTSTQPRRTYDIENSGFILVSTYEELLRRDTPRRSFHWFPAVMNDTLNF